MMPKSLQSQIASSIALGSLAITSPVPAQPIPDTTLPVNSVVTTKGNISTVTGGTRAGRNLFHSFREFSVSTGSTAYFNNASDIQNIISRVTGGSSSNIDGLIKANGAANLFLINPNGIMFGPHASLNIGGSFLASTAKSLKFADGTEFSATAPQTTTLLTISVPLGLQFGANSGAIGVQGDGQGLRSTSDADLIDTNTGLHVASNQTLALVGGDVALTGGTLKTAGGRIELGSVAGPSFVNLTPIDKGWTLGYKGVQNFGNIKLSRQAAVDVSGNGGGEIQVQGSQVTLTDGSQIEASTLGAEPGGNLVVNAQDFVQVIGNSGDDQFSSGLFANAYPTATGAAGNLTIKTGKLIASDGGQVSTGTLGQGQGGKLSVTASDSVELSGTNPDGQFGSGLFTQTYGAGATARDLTITTGQLIGRDGAHIAVSSQGSGSAGNLEVTASSIRLDNKAVLSADTVTGQGNITLHSGDLILRHGSGIITNATGTESGGNIFINAGILVAIPQEGVFEEMEQKTTSESFHALTVTKLLGFQPLQYSRGT